MSVFNSPNIKFNSLPIGIKFYYTDFVSFFGGSHFLKKIFYNMVNVKMHLEYIIFRFAQVKKKLENSVHIFIDK